MLKFVQGLVERLGFRKMTVYGCDEEDISDSPLLTRYYLITTKWGSLYLHIFHRSDVDRELHDHPWSFVTYPFWPGYNEWVPAEGFLVDPSVQIKRRVLPFLPHYRHATYSHRVEVINGPFMSLVVRFPTVRSWGFFTSKGWIAAKQFITDKGCSYETSPDKQVLKDGNSIH